MRFCTAVGIALAWFGTCAAAPAPVTAKSAAELAVYPRLTAPATVVSLNESRISAELRARIAAIPVLVGQRIREGEVLLRLEQRDFELARDRALASERALEAKLRLAEYQLERARVLVAQNNAPEELLNQREAERDILSAELEAQRVAVAAAERDLARCTLLAPFDAVVVARLGQVGELAEPGTPLLQVVDAVHLEVSAKIRGEDAPALESAASVELVSRGLSYPLELRVIIPVYDPRERSREARLGFKAASALPGSAGEIVFRNSRPYLPPALLLSRGGRLGVFVLAGERAHFVPLPDAAEGRPAAFDFPLGAAVIVEGRHGLQDGDAVSAR